MENEKILFEKAEELAISESKNFDSRIIVILLDRYNLLFDFIEKFQKQAIAEGTAVYNSKNFFQFLEDIKTDKKFTN